MIFLDMDGVLVDFSGYAFRLFGMQKPDKFDYGLGKYFGFQWYDAPFEWDKMEPTKFGLQLFKDCCAVTPNVWILTCPFYGKGMERCIRGKRKWVRKHLGNREVPYITFTTYKWCCARPGSVLIDDCEDHIDAFVEIGGSGILIPEGHNKLAGKEVVCPESLIKHCLQNPCKEYAIK